MKTLAIVGLGPRGLFALEQALICLATQKKTIAIQIFEPQQHMGVGAAWDLNQPNSNWVNITERALQELLGRPAFTYNNTKFKAFPSYHDWCDFKLNRKEVDTFPPRSFIGKYLNERFKSINSELVKSNIFEIVKSNVIEINKVNDKYNLNTDKSSVYKCDEVLLTIGHQPTELSKQLKSWSIHAKRSNSIKVELFEKSYPVEQFSDLKNSTEINIGLRGYGLAMIDVMRYLVDNTFGEFKILDHATFETEYAKNKEQHLKLIPYSLDGKPLAPKPLNRFIDNWYKPTQDELSRFESQIKEVAHGQDQVNNISFLISAFAKIATRVYLDLDDKTIAHDYEKATLHQLICSYLKGNTINTNLLENEKSSYDSIRCFIEMALGKGKISLDYCIGQVWRHCQPSLYMSFSYSKLEDGIIKQVVALDESTKRFSYGPPIESMQQILALVDAKVMSLDFVNDPDIKMVDEGWKLTNNNQSSVSIDVMLNCVLDSPKLLKVNTPIIKSLLENALIQPIHTELGIQTDNEGCVISKTNTTLPISVLGRLAKGSVIGVDAILECFGKRIEDWAKSFADRV